MLIWKAKEGANKSNIFSAGYRPANTQGHDNARKSCAVKCLDLFKLSDKAGSRSKARPLFLKEGGFRIFPNAPN